jgi:hypothetical protein
MSLTKITTLADAIADNIFQRFLVSQQKVYRITIVNGRLKCTSIDVCTKHTGLYGFRVKKNGNTAIIYIGKTEKAGRLRQHIQLENKDGSPLSQSVQTKHEQLKQLINDGYSVAVCLYPDPDFDKVSLCCIEIATALIAKKHYKQVFSGSKHKHWNSRLG